MGFVNGFNMKKLLAIVVLGLLLSSNAYAEEPKPLKGIKLLCEDNNSSKWRKTPLEPMSF